MTTFYDIFIKECVASPLGSYLIIPNDFFDGDECCESFYKESSRYRTPFVCIERLQRDICDPYQMMETYGMPLTEILALSEFKGKPVVYHLQLKPHEC